MTCYYKKASAKDTVVEYAYISESMHAWHEYFHTENYEDVDTTGHYAKLNNLPIFWNIEQQIIEAKTQLEKQMRIDSGKFGTECGLSIPLHGANGEYAELMFAQLKGEHCLDEWQTLQYELLTAAHYYYYYLREQLIKTLAASDDKYHLNDRQLQCLQLIALGHSNDEITKKLNITERTVNYHIQGMNKKLDTKNKYISVSKAQAENLID